MTWTAALLPDDALEPDSLVGRILNPEPTFTAEEAKMIAAPWSCLEPPATVEPVPPLLRAMTVASGQLLDATFGDATRLQCWAAEIEALRDLVLPEEPEPTTGGCLDQRRAIWRRDNQIRTWLTEQARIARGEQ
jgi:hypothetical protein